MKVIFKRLDNLCAQQGFGAMGKNEKRYDYERKGPSRYAKAPLKPSMPAQESRRHLL
jgi:hypothetical protein